MNKAFLVELLTLRLIFTKHTINRLHFLAMLFLKSTGATNLSERQKY